VKKNGVVPGVVTPIKSSRMWERPQALHINYLNPSKQIKLNPESYPRFSKPPGILPVPVDIQCINKVAVVSAVTDY